MKEIMNPSTGHVEQEQRMDALVKQIISEAHYAHDVLKSPKCYTTTQVAKDLQMSSKQLFRELLFLNIIYKKGQSYFIKQPYDAYDVARTRTYGTSVKDGWTLVWTEKGRMWIHQLRERGILCTIKQPQLIQNEEGVTIEEAQVCKVTDSTDFNLFGHETLRVLADIRESDRELAEQCEQRLVDKEIEKRTKDFLSKLDEMQANFDCLIYNAKDAVTSDLKRMSIVKEDIHDIIKTISSSIIEFEKQSAFFIDSRISGGALLNYS